jgi:hypothetical protein
MHVRKDCIIVSSKLTYTFYLTLISVSFRMLCVVLLFLNSHFIRVLFRIHSSACMKAYNYKNRFVNHLSHSDLRL